MVGGDNWARTGAMRQAGVARGWRLAERLLLQFLICSVAAVAQDRLGIVVDDRTGQPLAGARLSVEGSRTGGTLDALETAADGLVQIPAHPGESCRYRIARDGYVPMSLSLEENDREPFQARLAPLGWISGTVTDEQGEPVSGARVSALRWRDHMAVSLKNRLAPAGYHARTDARGRFRLHNLLPGDYALGVLVTSASGPGFTLYPENRHPTKIAVQPGSGQRDIAVVLTRELATHSVSGKVVFPNDHTLPASVFLTVRGQPQFVLSTTQAGPDGGFRFEQLAAGTYDVYAVAPSSGLGEFNIEVARQERLYAWSRVEATSGGGQEVTLPLGPGKTVSVSLDCLATSGCKKCPSAAQVTVSSLVPWGYPRDARSFELRFAGEHNLSGVPPGPLQLSVSGLGPSCFHKREPAGSQENVSSIEAVNVVIAPAADLQVTLAKSADATSARMEVYVLAEEAEFGESVRRAAAGKGERSYLFHDLRPGTYRINMASWSTMHLESGFHSIEIDSLFSK